MMSKILVDRKVLEQALEALEYENGWHEQQKEKPYGSTLDAMDALRKALERSELEVQVMNERIYKLAEQAKCMAEEDINRQISYNAELKAFAEKFAKLIVRECIGVIETKMPEFTGKEEYDNLIRKAGRLDAIDEIKEHVGVKE